MADMISYTRRLIADPAGGSQVFADADVQDALDSHQLIVRYDVLQPRPTVPVGGYVSSASYLDYYSALGWWEADEVLYDSAYNKLFDGANASSYPGVTLHDELVGHWVFSAGKLPPVYIVGKTYDLYGAAVDLLEEWAAKEKLSYAFAVDGQSFQEQQKSQALLELAAQYRKRIRIENRRTLPVDFVPEGYDWGMVYR